MKKTCALIVAVLVASVSGACPVYAGEPGNIVPIPTTYKPTQMDAYPSYLGFQTVAGGTSADFLCGVARSPDGRRALRLPDLDSATVTAPSGDATKYLALGNLAALDVADTANAERDFFQTASPDGSGHAKNCAFQGGRLSSCQGVRPFVAPQAIQKEVAAMHAVCDTFVEKAVASNPTLPTELALSGDPRTQEAQRVREKFFDVMRGNPP